MAPKTRESPIGTFLFWETLQAAKPEIARSTTPSTEPSKLEPMSIFGS
jgi:hypothetical protein